MNAIDFYVVFSPILSFVIQIKSGEMLKWIFFAVCGRDSLIKLD